MVRHHDKHQEIDASFPAPLQGVGMIPSTVGEEWLGLLGSGRRVTAHMVNTTSATQFLYSPKDPQGGLVAPHSAWGLDWELEVKPQLGTRKARPANTAEPPAGNGEPNVWYDETETYNVLASVAQQGAGLIQIDDAASATTLLSVSNLAFNDTDHLNRNATFSIKNTGSLEVAYQISHVKAATVYPPPDKSFLTNPDGFRLQAFPPNTAAPLPSCSHPTTSNPSSARGTR